MFKFFKKDYRHYLTRGEKHLGAGRFADARCCLQDALEKCPGDGAERQRITQLLQESGDRLAELNMAEGEGALNAGDRQKASEHFALALQLACDGKWIELAQQGLKKLSAPAEPPLAAGSSASSPEAGHCSSCKGHGGNDEGGAGVAESGLSPEDAFHLTVQPLPGDLPARYLAEGREFAQAYLMIHEGDDAGALPILQRLQRSAPSDVVMYELALIMFRSQRPGECQDLLRQALLLNPVNPLCHLAQVQLAEAAQRYPEALSLLETMQELGILSDQVLLLQGEVHAAAGDHEAALERWSRALSVPGSAKAAAEKLVPLLAQLGRAQEAQAVAKRYLKGCC